MPKEGAVVVLHPIGPHEISQDELGHSWDRYTNLVSATVRDFTLDAIHHWTVLRIARANL